MDRDDAGRGRSVPSASRIFFGWLRLVGIVLPPKYRLGSLVDWSEPGVVSRRDLTFLVELSVYLSWFDAAVIGGLALAAALLVPAMWPWVMLVACVVAGCAVAASVPWLRLKRSSADHPLADRSTRRLLDAVVPGGFVLGVVMWALAMNL